MDAATLEAYETEAQRELWRRGELSWKLDSNQQGIRSAMHDQPRGRFVLECARRLGKTFMLCVLATEVCLRKKRARVVYAGPTIKDVTEFILPNFDAVCEDAPPECKPHWDAQKGHLTFPNGSYVHVFGCDDKRKANRGRGPAADLVLVDEAGFISILGYVLKSVLRPQTLTTGARTFLASTPAEEPDHDFTKAAEQAEKNGTYVRRTIHDNPRLTPQRIADYIEEDARDEGMTAEEYMRTDTFRREYLAERVVDKRLVGVPEWAEGYQPDGSHPLVREVERPSHFDAYTVLDMGGADPHAVGLGYLHFGLGALVLEDELLLREGENTEELADAVKAKEAALWGTDRHVGTLRIQQDARELDMLPDWLRKRVEKPPPQQPYARYSDVDVQMVRDLHQLHGVSFIPTSKEEKDVMVNHLRVLVRRGRIIIHPRCRNTIRHLNTTVWKDERRTEWKRKGGEHGDLVDVLVYWARMAAWARNPFPPVEAPGPGYSRGRPKQPQGLAAQLAAHMYGKR